MISEHVLERLGRDMEKIGCGIMIGIAISVGSLRTGKVWPWILAGGLMVVGGLLQLIGWRFRRRKELVSEKLAA